MDPGAAVKLIVITVVIAIVALLAMVVVWRFVYRLRVAADRARFLRNYAGFVFIVGTTRKGWHPLFARLFENDQRGVYVWWRKRWFSPLRALQLRVPPVDLPFAVIVSPTDVKYVPLGSILRAHRGKPIAENAEIARERLRSLGAGDSAGAPLR